MKNTQPDKKELERIEEELKDAEINHGAAKAEAETARDEVEELNKQIGEKGKGKIEGIKKQIKKTKVAFDAILSRFFDTFFLERHCGDKEENFKVAKRRRVIALLGHVTIGTVRYI